MVKEKSNGLNKEKWKNSGVFILISFLTFFLFSLLSFITDSMTRQVEDYYIHFLTGDLLIWHDSGMIPASFMMPRMGFRDGEAPLINEYPLIEKFLSGIDDIVSFTPFSIDPVTCLNTGKGKITFWLKTIEPESFSKVFPEIGFAHTDEPPANAMEGIFLPRALVHQVEDILKIPLTGGNSLFISDEYARISSMREMPFSGIVSYRGYDNTLSWTAYTGASAYPFQKGKLKEAGDIITEHSRPGEDEFYQDITAIEPPIQKMALPDSYFFEFFTYNGGVNGNKDFHAPGWQYIAVSVGGKNRKEEVRNTLKRYFEMNSIPASVSTWNETAGSSMESILDKKITNMSITSFLLLFLFLLSLRINRKYAQFLKGNDKRTDAPAIVSLIKETAVSLNTGLCISALAGIVTSVIAVQIINAFGRSPGVDGWNTIIPWDDGLLISISLAPILASLLIVAVMIIIITIYPLFLLACHQQPGTGGKV